TASEAPLPSPRAVAAGPAATDTGPPDARHHDSTLGDVASDAVLAADAELELTAVVADEPVATELEIVKPDRRPNVPLHPAVSAGAGRHPGEDQDEASAAEPELAATAVAAQPDAVGRTAAPIRIAVLGPPRVYWRAGPGD